MVDADQPPERLRRQQGGLTGRLKPGAERVTVLGLLGVNGELLLEVLTVRADVAHPHSYLPRQFVLERDVPRLLPLVVPIRAVPIRRTIAVGRKALRGVDIHRGGREVIGRRWSRNQRVETVVVAVCTSRNVGIVVGVVLEP